MFVETGTCSQKAVFNEKAGYTFLEKYLWKREKEISVLIVQECLVQVIAAFPLFHIFYLQIILMSMFYFECKHFFFILITREVMDDDKLAFLPDWKGLWGDGQ